MSTQPERQAVAATPNSQAAEFVQGFTDAWAAPTLDALMALLHPSVRLVAPLTETTTGIASAREEFGRVFDLMPDLRGEVHRWRGDEEFVFIDFTLSATIGRRRIEWDVVDRFLLRDGRALERVSYFDPLPIAAALFTTPSIWPRWWKSGLGPPVARRRLLERS